MADKHSSNNLAERVMARLSADIRGGRLAPGARLPTEQELTSTMGVSRTVVREAVAALRADGLVVTRRGSGAYVADNPTASPFRIVLRHIMPLCISSLIIRVTLDMAGIILTAAGLGFLGLGAQPPLPEWGTMIASGRRFVLELGSSFEDMSKRPSKLHNHCFVARTSSLPWMDPSLPSVSRPRTGCSVFAPASTPKETRLPASLSCLRRPSSVVTVMVRNEVAVGIFRDSSM